MSKILVAVLFVLTCVSLAPAAGVEFDAGFVCGWDGYYRPMEWTPVEISIGSDATEPLAGTFSLSTRQDGLNTLDVTTPFVLTPGLPHDMPLVTKIGFGRGRCELAIRDERGHVQWQTSIEMWDDSGNVRQLYPIEERDLLIGVVGQTRFGLLHLSRSTASQSERGSGQVFLGSKVGATLPLDWTGFMSLDVLVLYDPDWSLLKRESLTAISQWVRNGGTLLLILGQHPPARTNPLTELIPFAIGDPREVQVDADILNSWGVGAHGASPLTAWPLTAKPAAQLVNEVVVSSGQCISGQGRVGFGRVAVLGLDPSQFNNMQIDQTAPFWVAQIKACLEDAPTEVQTAPVEQRLVGRPGDTPADMLRQIRAVQPQRMPALGRKGRTIVLSADIRVPGGRPSNSYQVGIAHTAGNQVMEFLYQLSQMKPLSIWWVVGILATLSLLLGPVDYFVLKRLDRLPLTWLTSLGWIVIFTVGAYYGVQYLRGGRMQLRAVSVVDGIAGTDCTWATYYSGLFAPQSDDYRLEGLDTRQWWSGIAPTEEQLGAFRPETGTRQIHCIQADGANLPASVPISIWTVQTLMTETPAASLPFAAAVELVGQDVAVKVTNLSDSRIVRGFVLLDGDWVPFDSVPAGASRDFRGPRREFGRSPRISEAGGRGLAGQTTPRYPPGLQMTTAFLAPGCFDRSLAMQSYLKAGAALVCVQYDDAPPPFSVENRSYETVHIQLARQVVFPKTSR